jgi:pimeloyl-ACP methyl ester carboxylesterase
MVECTITSQAPLTFTADALCGTLKVPEDRSEPSGRQIGLRVAVVPAAGTAASDAFVAIAGGPGDAGTAFFGWLPGLFAEVHETRDIVIVDQRGTGGSNALALPSLPDTSGLSGEAVDAALKSWADAWEASIDADPRQYTSSVAADDLDAVREALGYDQLDLYGPSYGGTLAQYYLRQHPDRVRVAVLDGATPLDVPVFERMAASSQGALELLIGRCQADTACHAAFPQLEAEWAALQAALAQGVQTDITDPSTGQPGVVTLEMLAPGIHRALLDPATAARLPLGLHLAAEGKWSQAAALFPDSSSGDGGDWLAMREIIVCSEAWARFDPAEVEQLGAGSYELPTELADARARAARCGALPTGVVPADDARPVVTDVPILWLTGDGDPQDPPANLTSIATQQPNARVAVMPAQQHTVSHSGCAPEVIAQLVETGTTDGLDTSCIERAAVPGLTFTLPDATTP